MMSIVEALLKGDHRSMSKAISLVEDGRPEAKELLKKIFPYTGKSLLIGVTGTPGTGKSTLVDKMVLEYRKRGKKVGVLAVDPTSPFSGGALLGDRVRMAQHSADEGVFIRSMATRGALGGLALAAVNAVRVLDASGMDVILLETMGIGQDEVEVIKVVDVTVVVLMPQAGDEVQSYKAGLMEIGDIFVVNKSDLEGADRTASGLQVAITGRNGWKPPVFKIIAKTGEGVSELVGSIERFKAFQKESGEVKELARMKLEDEILDMVCHSLVTEFRRKLGGKKEFRDVVSKVLVKEIDTITAAEQLFSSFGGLKV